MTLVMMTVNYRRLALLARMAAGFGANPDVSIYRPARIDRFTLVYEPLSASFRDLAATTRVVAGTEPGLAGALGPAFDAQRAEDQHLPKTGRACTNVVSAL